MARRPDPFLTDDDNPELTDADLAVMKPASEFLPPALYAALVSAEPTRRQGQRGFGKKPAKVAMSIRIEPEILAAWKATGEGWQTRVGDVLREAVTKPKRRA